MTVIPSIKENTWDNIPPKLRTLPHWVNWKAERRNGKTTKIPLNPLTLQNARSNDSASWGVFSAALAQCNNSEGIGFMFEGSGITGIDLDHVRDPDTGRIETWALNLIREINSYTEVSPSGAGVHILVETNLPPGGRRSGQIEIYDSGRFFTVTGKSLPRFTEIKQWDGEKLHSLIMVEAKDQQLLKKAFEAENGAKFQKLWAGNWNEYPSQSEADMALASLLFFWTGTNQETDRLFRKSGLYRDKWDEKHFADGKTYGEDIVNKVCEGKTYKEGLDSVSAEWPEVIALDDYSTLPDFPTKALPEPGRKMVEAVVEVNQVDAGLPGGMFLGMLAACGAKKIEVDLKSHKEPCNLFLNLILDSGNRKTSTMSNMTSPLYEYQKMKAEEMRDIIRIATNKDEIRKQRLTNLQRKAAQANDETERIRLQRDAEEIKKDIEENPVPKSPLLIVDDITSEALAVQMAENDERLAVVSAEGGIFGIMAGRYNDKGGNFDVYLKGHAGDPFSAHRIGREAKHMQSPALTMCLTVQEDVAREAGKNRQFRGRGLLARFLYCLCKSQVGYRARRNESIPASLIVAYREYIQRLTDIPLTMQTLILEPEAQAVWTEFYNEIEADMRPGYSLSGLKDWGSKLPGAVARIAGLLHFAEYGERAGEYPISVSIVNASCAIGAYYREHALATFGLMAEDPRIESGKTIFEYLYQHDRRTFKGRDVLRNKNSFKTMDDVAPGIRVLIERGYIRVMEPSSVKKPEGGRPEATVYEVNPKINTLRNQRQ